MPSGSHRTSGGSHSSGGSSSSGSSFGGGGHHHGGYHHGRVRGGFYVNGRRMGPVGTIIFLSFFTLFFSGMWLFGAIFITAQRNKELEKVEMDYIYYQDMISFAEEHEDEGYIIEGTVTGKFLSEYEDKWYLTYSFEGSYSGVYMGETYAIYTYEEAKNFIPNVTKILLAADSNIITATTDTVNIDYKNTTLEDDGYYIHMKSSMLVPQIICFAVAGGSAILFVSLIIAEVKKLKNGTTVNPDNSPVFTPNISEDQRPTFCQYCGAKIQSRNSRCPNCGAKQ